MYMATTCTEFESNSPTDSSALTPAEFHTNKSTVNYRENSVTVTSPWRHCPVKYLQTHNGGMPCSPDKHC